MLGQSRNHPLPCQLQLYNWLRTPTLQVNCVLCELLQGSHVQGGFPWARWESYRCSSALRSPSWRANAMTSQMTSSATLRVLLKGALNTGMPRALAACSAQPLVDTA